MTTQIEKFEKKLEKSMTTTKKPIVKTKIRRYFGFIDLTDVNRALKEVNAKKPNKNIIHSSTVVNEKVDLDILFGNKMSYVSDSVKGMMDELHPDLLAMIKTSGVSSMKLSCGIMTIITKNSMKIIISRISAEKKKVKIVHNNVILLDQLVECQVVIKRKEI